jgi:hypothetical protein
MGLSARRELHPDVTGQASVDLDEAERLPAKPGDLPVEDCGDTDDTVVTKSADARGNGRVRESDLVSEPTVPGATVTSEEIDDPSIGVVQLGLSADTLHDGILAAVTRHGATLRAGAVES